MYTLESTNQFKKDFKSLSSQDAEKVIVALNILAETGTLPRIPYLTHKLKGDYAGNFEAHLRPNLLLIWYEICDNTIKLIRVGSHTKLFKQ